MSRDIETCNSSAPSLGASLFVTLLVAGDILIALSAVALAYFVRFEGAVPDPFRSTMLPVMMGMGILIPLIFAGTGLYNYVWRQVGIDMVLRVAGVVAMTGVSALIMDFIVSAQMDHRAVPIGVVIISFTFLFIGAATTRALSRTSRYMRTRAGAAEGRPVLIVGAGDAGSLLLRDIETQPTLGLKVIGLLDDDPGKHGRMMRSAKVLGSVADVCNIVREQSVTEILIAIPSAPHSEQARVLDLCAEAHVPVRVMPGIATAAQMVGFRDLRSVEILDLLGREPAPIDIALIRQTIEERVVLVTGAAGSIGSELCRQLLIAEPKRVMLIDVDESRLYSLFLELEDTAPGVPEMRICDIRDDRKLHEIFAECRPQVVIHAAAYKHVPLMEIEPDEAVKTNVVGTWNVVEACLRARVDRFVLISTDKAVAPKSVMGMTKAIGERITMSACSRGLNATAVRFGNVLGSRGSVIPLFEEQLKRGGALRVTHPDVTRYFMTIPEAARLVLQAQALSESGDIFVLEMGDPVRIVDLAEKMIALSGTDARVEFTGLRPAEKLHEVLTDLEEDLMPTGAAKISCVNAVTIPPSELEGLIHGLGAAARLNDRAMVKQIFKRLLPDCDGFGTNALEYIDESDSVAALSVVDSEMETLL